jgi:hypothetical protein
MDSSTGLALVVAIVIVVAVGAFLYECGRRVYYWSAARICGWSDREKFMRETAWLDRAVAEGHRQAKRDAEAAADTQRRRMGVYLTSVAVAALGWHLPWWEVGLIAAGVYVGITMASGLAWKWW